MAIINLSSPVFSQLIAPALPLINDCPSSRHCPELSDSHWLALGLARCLEAHSSGRSFLQSLASHAPELCLENTHLFESLKSTRRLSLNRELNGKLCALAQRILPDQLSAFACLDGFDVFAGDGHAIEHACHDPRDAKTGAALAVGHLYTRNLRTGMLRHLDVADQLQRKKEHDMRALKRARIDALRHGAPKGRKTLIVWDRAGIDFHQWFQWKQGSGIYMLSRTKENMEFTVVGALPYDRSDPINAGVLADELVSPSTAGVTLRRVRFFDIGTGRTFEFITNLLDQAVPPGVIAQLYRMRWDIEKTFDELKNKFAQKKAWATSATAKNQQAAFICLAFNLLLLLQHQLAHQPELRNKPEDERRARRLEKLKFKARKAGAVLPRTLLLTQRCTQIGVKLIRWVAAHLWKTLSLQAASVALATLYARL